MRTQDATDHRRSGTPYHMTKGGSIPPPPSIIGFQKYRDGIMRAVEKVVASIWAVMK